MSAEILVFPFVLAVEVEMPSAFCLSVARFRCWFESFAWNILHGFYMEVSVQERFTSTGVGQSTEDLALPMALNSDGDSLQQPNIRRGVWSQILLMSLFAALLYGSKGFAGTAKVAMKKDHFGSHQEILRETQGWMCDE